MAATTWVSSGPCGTPVSSGGTPMPGKAMDTRRDDDMKGNVFIGVVAAAGAAVLGQSVYHLVTGGFETKDLAWLGIALLTLMVGRLSVKLPLPHCRVSFSDAFIFLSVMVFGPELATLTAALDGFASSARGAWHKRVFNTAGMALSVNVAARFFVLLAPRSGVWESNLPITDLLLPVSVMALTQYVLNTALVGTVVALKEHQSLLA